MKTLEVLAALSAGLCLAIPVLPAAAAPSPADVPATRLAGPPALETTTIGVGSNPYDVAIAQNLGRAYVVNDGSVSVLSLLTQRKLADFGTDANHGQNALTLVRGNTQGYITRDDDSRVIVFDTETSKVLRTIDVGRGADVVKVNTPRGQRAYIALLHAKRLAGIKTSTSKVVQQIDLPHPAQVVTAGRKGRTVWAGSEYEGRIYVADTTSGKVTRTIHLPKSGPVTSIAFTRNHKRAWIAEEGGVSVVDVRTGKVTKFLPVQRLFDSSVVNMGALALNGSGRHVLVENSTFPDSPRAGEVTLVDTKTFEVVSRTATGVEPVALAVDTRRGVAYTPDYADDTVTAFPDRPATTAGRP